MLTVIAVLGVLASGLVFQGAVREWLDEPRNATTSSPGLSALFTRATTTVKAGSTACLKPVTFAADTGRVRFRLRVPQRVPPKIDVVASGPGYRAVGVVPALDPRAEGTAEAIFRPPGRQVDGTLCWRNRGPTPVELIGTNEGRSQTPTDATLDGELIEGAEIEAILFKTRPLALRYREGELLERAASLTRGVIPEWLLWPVLLLLAGLPFVVAALFGWSVWRSTRRDAV